MSELESRGVILCDEIREEKNGKFLIIGVFSAGVVVQEMPANLRLSLYLMLKFPQNGTFELIISAEAPGAKTRMAVELEILDYTNVMAVPTPQMPFKIKEPGDLTVSVGLSEDELFEAARYPVTVNPEIWAMYPIEFEPPSEQSENDAQD